VLLVGPAACWLPSESNVESEVSRVHVTGPTDGGGAVERRTLPGTDYWSPEVFDAERESVFFRSWFLAGRTEQVNEPGDFFTVDVVGESILVVRGDDGELNAFYNVCRHRGSRLHEEAAGRDKRAIVCPYHAWCYSFSGELIGTPRVGDDEVDRSRLGLRSVHVDSWQGLVFVNLVEGAPVPLTEWLGSDIVDFERFDIAALRMVATQEWVIEANWKIVMENYLECLHCPTVHPELVAVVPTYRRGMVSDPDRTDGGVASLSRSYAAPGTAAIAVLPTMTEMEADSIYGGSFFPNGFLDIAGTGVVVTQLIPLGPTTTREVAWYLFHPDAIAADDFDPSGVIDFCDLVVRQDNDVCERAQRGSRSRSFREGGVYPEKDADVWAFNQRYLQVREAAQVR
jgi:glycine betaine catabolism A